MERLDTEAMIDTYFRPERLPHIWCPGCAHGPVTSALVRAVAAAELDQSRTAVVSGIGCSSRATGYLDFSTLHTTHGRALAYATGIKLGNPDLKVIVISGDGDLSAIGGNHLIHACRRNLDLTVICYQNGIYGMTGGQAAPTTPAEMISTTTPYGQLEPSFDLCRLAIAAGATYVARGTAYHAEQLQSLIQGALSHQGFALVEAISSCPTYYGKMNEREQPVESLNWMRDHAVPYSPGMALSGVSDHDSFPIGLLHQDKTAPEYTARYRALTARF